MGLLLNFKLGLIKTLMKFKMSSTMINNDFGLAFAIHLLEKYIQVERKNIYMMYLRTLRRRIYIFSAVY